MITIEAENKKIEISSTFLEKREQRCRTSKSKAKTQTDHSN